METTHLDFETNNCFANFHWQGMTLAEWQTKMNFQFSLGELYRMAKEEKKDFSTLHA